MSVAKPDNQATAGGGGERRVLAILAVVLLHAALLCIGAVAAAIEQSSVSSVQLAKPWRFLAGTLPHSPLLLTAIGLVLAQASLSAIWWARTSWPSHVKTLVAVLAVLATWVFLRWLMPHHRVEAAAGWAACLMTQTVLAGLGAALLGWTTRAAKAKAPLRYSVAYLLAWTSVVAALLGGARWLASSIGWTPENFFAWHYFRQLQLLGVANAILAVAVLAEMRCTRSWWVTGACLATTVLAAAGITPVAMWTLFDRLGAQPIEIAWLSGSQGLFLIAALLPVEVANAAGGGRQPGIR